MSDVSRGFEVRIDEAIEASAPIYYVNIIHPDRPKDAMPWDIGIRTVCSTRDRKNAEFMKENWDAFLNMRIPEYDF